MTDWRKVKWSPVRPAMVESGRLKADSSIEPSRAVTKLGRLE